MEFDAEKTNPYLTLEDIARAEVEKGLAKLELTGDPGLNAIIDQVAVKEKELSDLLAPHIVGKRYERNGEVVTVRRIKPGLIVELVNPKTKTVEEVYVGMFEGKLLDEAA